MSGWCFAVVSCQHFRIHDSFLFLLSVWICIFLHFLRKWCTNSCKGQNLIQLARPRQNGQEHLWSEETISDGFNEVSFGYCSKMQWSTRPRPAPSRKVLCNAVCSNHCQASNKSDGSISNSVLFHELCDSNWQILGKTFFVQWSNWCCCWCGVHASHLATRHRADTDARWGCKEDMQKCAGLCCTDLQTDWTGFFYAGTLPRMIRVSLPVEWNLFIPNTSWQTKTREKFKFLVVIYSLLMLAVCSLQQWLQEIWNFGKSSNSDWNARRVPMGQQIASSFCLELVKMIALAGEFSAVSLLILLLAKLFCTVPLQETSQKSCIWHLTLQDHQHIYAWQSQ